MSELDFDRELPAGVDRDRHTYPLGVTSVAKFVAGGEIFLSTLEMRLADARERGEDPNAVMADYHERREALRG